MIHDLNISCQFVWGSTQLFLSFNTWYVVFELLSVNYRFLMICKSLLPVFIYILQFFFGLYLGKVTKWIFFLKSPLSCLIIDIIIALHCTYTHQQSCLKLHSVAELIWPIYLSLNCWTFCDCNKWLPHCCKCCFICHVNWKKIRYLLGKVFWKSLRKSLVSGIFPNLEFMQW